MDERLACVRFSLTMWDSFTPSQMLVSHYNTQSDQYLGGVVALLVLAAIFLVFSLLLWFRRYLHGLHLLCLCSFLLVESLGSAAGFTLTDSPPTNILTLTACSVGQTASLRQADNVAHSSVIHGECGRTAGFSDVRFDYVALILCFLGFSFRSVSVVEHSDSSTLSWHW